MNNQKITFIGDKERYFMGYISENIYQVYFSNNQQIKTIQDLEFDESYSYEKIGIIIIKNLFFSFFKLEFFIGSTYNTPIRKEKELFAILFTPSIIYPKVKDNNNDYFFFILSNNNTLSL